MKLYLVDGYGFIFRAYHSLPPLSSPDGIPVSAVYGFVNMMIKLCESHKPNMLAVVMDSGTKNYRHRLFPGYKSNRPEPPKELKVQFAIIREALRALNIKIIEVDGYEADDLIATYALAAIKSDNEVTVVSSDKDFMQLLAYDKIYMYDPVKNKLIGERNVEEKFGVCSAQLCDALALIGDKSDNIPGVQGIGPKTASDLIKQYKSIEEIYNNIDKVKSERIKGLLIANRDNAFLSKQLVSLKLDVPVEISFIDMQAKQPEPENLFAFAQKFGFKSLINKYGMLHAKDRCFSYEQIELKKITSNDLNSSLKNKIETNGIVAIYFNSKEFFIAGNDFNYILNYELLEQKELFDSQDKITLKEIITFLKPILVSDSITKILFNAKALIKLFNQFVIDLVAFDDLAIMSYVVSTKNQYKDLKELISKQFIDAFEMISCYHELKKEIINLKLFNLYEALEKPLISLLASVELKGVLVDKQMLDSISLDFTNRAKVIARSIYAIANQEFNIASPKQLSEILFEKLKLPTTAKKSSKSGNYIADSEVLKRLELQGYEIAKLVLEWRHLTKLTNTYTEALQKSITPKTGRIHTTFEMNGTSTGRLSSHSPNLQNIPIKTEDGKRIRKAFIANLGNVLISADYSQIELRLLAHFADIDQLKEAFLKNQDIHAVTASEIFGVPINQVDSDLRRKAKGINFGIIYGISPFGLAKNVGISWQDAKNYIENYFVHYPGIREYMDKSINFARKNNYVETIFKRRCFIEGINSSNYNIRVFAERAAINAPLQGSSADIIKKAIVLLPKHLTECLILQIHDELLFEVSEEKAKAYANEITKIMKNVTRLTVPLEVAVSICRSWE